MDKEEKKQSGISLFGQSDYLMAENDPIEEMFALNLGDFISETLISEDLAKKISVKANKKERLENQLKELIDIYSSKNTLCVLNFSAGEEQAIYTSIAKSIVQMLEVQECRIHLIKNEKLVPIGLSSDFSEPANLTIKDLLHNEIIENNGYLYISMRSSTMPIGMIEIKSDKQLDENFIELILSISNLLGTTISLQSEVEVTNKLIHNPESSEFELKQARAELTALIGDLCDYQQNFVESLANAVDKKGQYTVSHSRNSAKLARNICKKLGLNEKTTDLIYYAGLLQNIGKITLPEKIFANNGKLSAEELQKIKNHTNIGVNLLMNINFLSEVVPYITYQTERVDGTGSPEGLKGQSIPLGSRIIAVADAYCAMTSDRPYRKAIESNQAFEIISSEINSKWDKDVVNALAQVIK